LAHPAKQWSLYGFMVVAIALVDWPRRNSKITQFVPRLLEPNRNAHPTSNCPNNRVSVTVLDESLRNYWDISDVETGHWATDCRLGEAIAKRCADVLRQRPYLLALIVRDMIARGHYGGLESGFCTTLAETIVSPEVRTRLDQLHALYGKDQSLPDILDGLNT